MTPATKRFEIACGKRIWSFFDDAWAAEREAAKLRSHGFQVFVRDRQRVVQQRFYDQGDLFPEALERAKRLRATHHR